MVEKDERTLAMLIYLISFFTAFIGPLLIWLLKKDESQFIDHHGREYFNFLISFTVYSIVSAILIIIVIGAFLLAIVAIGAFILTIVAAIKAYEGDYYRFPFIFRIL
ncbi:hypothetical protein BKP45_00635 [Anaerobacillus alkalidiazotrophicus]|uniref:DUF4870 domain-containing protein n=1 Tax=Anaerobacillus alkalidiazotrophicus TaxID=472963 RepID=A0A1S2M956_9BACI|nr:DUF4870 domain-containing protein [Anaerobacillus alkalidiazotrophicus]OIJ21322.1 hypothetical protein BKP45_00635 [Anaerobacillus alkalidiazotrophicus]